MAAQLRIGEAARLLGISTKTIRHYHRVGLLREPTRTEGGYRVYQAADIVRLVRIRRLQRLGLSLAQIQRVLGEPEASASLRQVLTTIVEALDEDIQHLQTRRNQVAALLAHDNLDIDHPATLPTILARVYERVSPEQRDIPSTIWEQDRRIFGMLESLALPDGYHQQMTTMAEQTLSDPVLYSNMLVIAERLAALADVPADSPLVEQLVHQAQVEGWLTQMQALAPVTAPSEGGSRFVGEVMMSILAPAQQRFLQLLMQGDAA